MNDKYDSRELNHLGLVSGMCDELGIVSIIDNLIKQDTEQRNVTVGECVKALILNGLGFSQRRIYLTPDFFKDKPTELLLGENIKAEHLNGTVLSRALDKVYDFGINTLFQRISVNACKVIGLASGIAHIDSTSFHVDGIYNSQNPPPQDSEEILITKGYSRDHHPNLNQVMLNLIVENKAGIPLQMQALSGNSSDNTEFREMITKHIENLKSEQGIEYITGDSALYTEQNLKEISSLTNWISRVPETINQAKETIGCISKDAMHDINENYKYCPLCSKYAGVKQRWILIWSAEAFQRELKTLNKNFALKGEKEIKKFDKLCNLGFACIEDAQIAFEEFNQKCKFIDIDNFTTIEEFKYQGKGRPRKDAKPTKKVYKISGTCSSSIENYNQMKSCKGKFIIATNELDPEKLSDIELFQTYKDQNKVERGFRFLKDPQFLASTIFVKSPHRIQVILMIMTLCLMVYAALEYKLREGLKKSNLKVPNQKKKLIVNPTMRWVFNLFRGIHILNIVQVNKTTSMNLEQVNKTASMNLEKVHKTVCMNLDKVHFNILNIMGEKYKKYYLLI